MGVDHQDVLDTAEMEMCFRSSAFIRYFKSYRYRLPVINTILDDRNSEPEISLGKILKKPF